MVGLVAVATTTKVNVRNTRAYAKLGIVSGSTISKILMGTVFSAVLSLRLSAAETVNLFQVILAQSVIITVATGGGYILSVTESTDHQNLALKTARAMALCAMAVMVAVAVRLLVTGTPSLSFLNIGTLVQILLLAGAIATSFAAVIQGFIAAGDSSPRAFAPIMATSLLFTIGLALPGLDTPDAFGAYLAFYQMACLLSLVAASGLARSIIIAAVRRLTWSSTWKIQSPLTFGVINALCAALVFAFRENWKLEVPAAGAAPILLVFRLSDLYLGIGIVVLADTHVAARIREHSVNFITMVRRALLIAVVATASLAAIFALSWSTVLPVLIVAILSQILVDMLRSPSALTSMAQLQKGYPIAYTLVVLPPIALAWLVTAALGYDNDLVGIYVFALIGSLFQVFAFQIAAMCRRSC